MRTGVGTPAANSEPRTCGHCGADDVGTLRAGYSWVDMVPLCHPYVGGRPDCYRLVTIFGHPMPCSGCRDLLWARS